MKPLDMEIAIHFTVDITIWESLRSKVKVILIDAKRTAANDVVPNIALDSYLLIPLVISTDPLDPPNKTAIPISVPPFGAVAPGWDSLSIAPGTEMSAIINK